MTSRTAFASRVAPLAARYLVPLGLTALCLYLVVRQIGPIDAGAVWRQMQGQGAHAWMGAIAANTIASIKAHMADSGVDKSIVLGIVERADQVRRVNDWLTLELEFVQTGANPKRVQANEMIPEINARGNQVIDGIGDVEFVYNLRGPGE